MTIDFLSQRKVRIHLQHVQRDVVGGDTDRGLDGGEPLRHVLAGQPHHEIDADVVEPRRARHRHGIHRTLSRVEASETCQLGVTKRLDAEAQTIDTGAAKLFQARLRNGFRVCFEGDFGVGGERHGRPSRVDDRAHIGWAEQRWRAAAEVQGVRGEGRPSLYLTHHGCNESCLHALIKESAVEVAVVADGAAERDVNVQSGDWGLGIEGLACGVAHLEPARPPDHFRSALPSPPRSCALAWRLARPTCSSFPRMRRSSQLRLSAVDPSFGSNMR